MNESELSIFNRVWQVCQEHNQNDLVTIRNWINVEIIAHRSRFPTNTISINENFIFNNIKKNLNLVFKKNTRVLLVFANFPKKGSRANTISLIEKKIFLS